MLPNLCNKFSRSNLIEHLYDYKKKNNKIIVIARYRNPKNELENGLGVQVKGRSWGGGVRGREGERKKW